MDLDISCKDLGKFVGFFDGGLNLLVEFMFWFCLLLSLCDIWILVLLGFFFVVVLVEV